MMSNVQMERLGDLFSFKNGRAFRKEEWSSNGLPIIRIQNLNNEDASFNYFSGEYSEDILVRAGDLLFSWSGTVGSSFGSHLWDRERGVLNQHIFKVGLSDGIDKRYAFHALRFITDEIELQVSGAVGLVHITKEKLNEFRIPLPSLSEQNRIVALLDEAFAGIATAKANAEKSLRSASEVFDKKLAQVFSGHHPGWVAKRLHEVCAITSTLVDPRESEYINATHVGAGNIESKTGKLIDLKTSREEALISGKFPFDATMVLYSKIRPYLEKVARPNFSGVCSADMYPLAPIEGQILRDFLYWLLLSKPFTDYAIRGSARAGMPKVNRDHLFQYEIELPGVVEQKHIIGELNTLRCEVECLQSLYTRKLAALDELKQSLLQRAFSGQL